MSLNEKQTLELEEMYLKSLRVKVPWAFLTPGTQPKGNAVIRCELGDFLVDPRLGSLWVHCARADCFMYVHPEPRTTLFDPRTDPPDNTDMTSLLNVRITVFDFTARYLRENWRNPGSASRNCGLKCTGVSLFFQTREAYGWCVALLQMTGVAPMSMERGTREPRAAGAFVEGLAQFSQASGCGCAESQAEAATGLYPEDAGLGMLGTAMGVPECAPPGCEPCLASRQAVADDKHERQLALDALHPHSWTTDCLPFLKFQHINISRFAIFQHINVGEAKAFPQSSALPIP